jgi:hypothetical protein
MPVHLVARRTALLVALLLASASAHALPLQPPGLAPGETYHWMFITAGKIDSVSADIAVYNNFVTLEAALNPDLAGLGWHAIASTETVDARLNAPVSGKVFLLDQTQFADDFPHMWNGSSKAFSPSIDQFGAERAMDPFPWVWTGTDSPRSAHQQQYRVAALRAEQPDQGGSDDAGAGAVDGCAAVHRLRRDVPPAEARGARMTVWR